MTRCDIAVLCRRNLCAMYRTVTINYALREDSVAMNSSENISPTKTISLKDTFQNNNISFCRFIYYVNK